MYATSTEFGRCVLHGAFAAGIVSKMAGMILPGRDCLLHGIRLRFLRPVFTPARLRARGTLVRDDGKVGEVQVSIEDAVMGQVLIEGVYQFGRHRHTATPTLIGEGAPRALGEPCVLVTGATGGLGAAVLQAFGASAIGVSRQRRDGMLTAHDADALGVLEVGRPIAAIVHCGWPEPDGQALLDLADPASAVWQHITEPILQILALARLLKRCGRPGATLVLVGSTFAKPGRHGWRMPLYSTAKRTLEVLVPALALELSPWDRRVVGVSFDVIDGGMNRSTGESWRQSQEDRTLSGILPNPAESAEYLRWVVESPGRLANGVMIDLSGGALP
jgi:NAD(P)-dependent dehydrogenase (short-subunit alcohol dehydrogenase family)